MGAHHDINMIPPRAFRAEPLAENEQCDFERSYSGRIETTYTNNLSVTVYIADRHGAVITCRPQHGNGKFNIRVSRFFGRTTIAHYQTDAFTMRIGKARPTPLDHARRDNYSVVEPSREAVGKTRDLRVGINMEDLIRNDGVIYHEESDLVISTTIDKAIHFGSPMEVLKRMTAGHSFEELELAGKNALSNIVIVENQGKLRDRFIRIAGEVHRIKPSACPSRKSGIYIERQGWVTEANKVTDSIVFHELTDEIEEELGFFKTYEEALNWAEDLKLSSEREITKSKHDLVVAKLDTEKVSLERKDEFDKKSTERKDTYDERQHHRKDYYDYTALHRKDTSDELKWVLGLATALIGLVALIRR